MSTGGVFHCVTTSLFLPSLAFALIIPPSAHAFAPGPAGFSFEHVHPMKLSRSTLVRAWLCAMTLSCFEIPAAAQSAASGTIEGRVLNTRNGEYLEKARVTIEGTTLESFTDASGQYRLTNVPAGTAKVKVFYTGQDATSDIVTVSAGETVQHDFNLAAGQMRPGADRGGPVVQLDQFVVSTSKEMDAAAIAINEQR